MKPSANTVSQKLSADDQNYKVDIEQIYNSFITQIDNIRSNVSIANQNAKLKMLLQSVNASAPPNNDPDYFKSQLLVDPNNVQESRCHAFYRLLGLPVVSPDGDFYSPGFNAATNLDFDINKTNRKIASKISDDLYSLMDAREITTNNFLKIFGLQDINASVLAASSANLRKFNVIETSSGTIDPFDTNLADQTHTFTNTVNISNTADFSNYQDSNGNMPTSDTLGSLLGRRHVIKPFMVDPRVELTVNPPYVGAPGNNNNSSTCKIMAAPFALDKSQLLYTENVYCFRPVIETICRKRFLDAQPTTALSARFQSVLNYVQNTNEITDSTLLDKVYANPTKTPEDQIFINYLNIMRAMIDELVVAVHNIMNVEIVYHWVPIPNVKGPEYGSTTQSIIIGDPLNSNVDVQIVNKIITSEINQINSQSTQQTQADLGNFIDFEIQPSPDDTTTPGFGNISDDVLDEMTSDRTTATNKANDSLKTIEIIMGEFSGLGLCDIIAIYLALWTIDDTVLVNMLDNEAFIRLSTFTELQSEVVQSRISNNNNPTMGIVDVLTSFEEKVSEIYNLMDKLLLDRQNNNIK